jgi:D-alanyl-D-alanine carboxypeptidase (penicillin-binding protein 5/6)
VTLPRGARSGLKAVVSFEQPIQAPVKKGQQIGVLTISAPDFKTETIPLVATSDVAEVGFFTRIYRKLGFIFSGKKA